MGTLLLHSRSRSAMTPGRKAVQDEDSERENANKTSKRLYNSTNYVCVLFLIMFCRVCLLVVCRLAGSYWRCNCKQTEQQTSRLSPFSLSFRSKPLSGGGRARTTLNLGFETLEKSLKIGTNLLGTETGYTAIQSIKFSSVTDHG